jgi:branched-chain amino acid transport system substrate-binding protein
MRRRHALTGIGVALIAGATRSRAQTVVGVTPTEIKIGHTIAYSGPASSYGVIGKLEAAFWNMVNEQGGVAGRKINFISYEKSKRRNSERTTSVNTIACGH